MKVILGPVPCHSCGDPVTVVRRDVQFPCDPKLVLTSRTTYTNPEPHTHTIPDVGPFTTVDVDGTRHECAR